MIKQKSAKLCRLRFELRIWTQFKVKQRTIRIDFKFFLCFVSLNIKLICSSLSHLKYYLRCSKLYKFLNKIKKT